MDVLVGLDVLSQQENVTMLLEGKIHKLVQPDFSAAVMKTPNEFSARNTEPPDLFSEKMYTTRPIATQKKNIRQQYLKYNAIEIAKLLELGIIEPSVSLRRTQAFAVHSHKLEWLLFTPTQ